MTEWLIVYSLYCPILDEKSLRYQRGNQNPLIEEEQTTQWPKEEEQTTQWPKEEEQTTEWPKERGQNNKQWSTKHYTEN